MALMYKHVNPSSLLATVIMELIFVTLHHGHTFQNAPATVVMK